MRQFISHLVLMIIFITNRLMEVLEVFYEFLEDAVDGAEDFLTEELGWEIEKIDDWLEFLSDQLLLFFAPWLLFLAVGAFYCLLVLFLLLFVRRTLLLLLLLFIVFIKLFRSPQRALKNDPARGSFWFCLLLFSSVLLFNRCVYFSCKKISLSRPFLMMTQLIMNRC